MSNPYRPPDPDAPVRPPAPTGGRRPGAEEGQGQGQGPGQNQQQGQGPGQPGTAPHGRPTAPPDPKAVALAGRRVRDFALFLLAALLTSNLPVPWQIGSLLLAIGAVVAGVRALVAVWRSGLRTLVLPALGVGVGFAAMFAVSLAVLVALWPLQAERQQCLRDALTLAAREECETRFTEQLDERLTDALTPGR